MSEYSNLRKKFCSCCNVRLDTVKKTNIKRINDNAILTKLNNVKGTILLNKRKPENDTILKIGDYICGGCRSYANKYGDNQPGMYPTLNVPDTTTTRNVQQRQIQPEPTNIITVKIPRAISSQQSCVVCNKTRNLVDIPENVYLDSFISRNILIPNGAKCCKQHLNSKGNFYKNDMNKIEVVSNTTVLKDYEVKLTLDRLRHYSKCTMLEKFSTPSQITENDCKSYIGFDKQQFSSILNDLKSLKNSPGRNKSQVLATYLFWLKTGLDYQTISTILSLDNFQTVGEYCEQVSM
jgi:hypothetical protein